MFYAHINASVFAGEVNVAQELLPSLLHTARAFKIKGLDKVETPKEVIVQPPVADPVWTAEGEAQAVPTPTHGAVGAVAAAAAATGPQSPSDVKPPFPAEHFLRQQSAPEMPVRPGGHLPAAAVAAAAAAVAGVFPPTSAKRGRSDIVSPPPSLPGSQPPTREASPCPPRSEASAGSARTPPPKRWKRSFDMAQPVNGQKDNQHQVS